MAFDYLGNRSDNLKLVNAIRKWWADRGFTIKVWTERAADPLNNKPIWVVRTNIVQDVRTARPNYTVI